MVTAGDPKVAAPVEDPPPPPKLNNPAVADVVVGPADVCDKEDDLDPKPKTFGVAEAVVAAVVFGAEEFPKENKFVGAAAAAVVVAAVGAGLEPPKLNILAGDLVVVAAGAAAGVSPGAPKEKATLEDELVPGAASPPPVVVVVAAVAPPKLKAGAGAEVVVEVELEVLPSWKLGPVLAAPVLLPPKLKVSEGAETELEVAATVDVGPRPNDRVLAAGVLSGCDPPPTPKLKGAMAAVEDEVETAGRLLELVEAGAVVAGVVEAGRLNVTVAVFTEVAALVVSDEDVGEEIVPNEKGVDVVVVTELSEAVRTEVAAVV